MEIHSLNGCHQFKTIEIPSSVLKIIGLNSINLAFDGSDKNSNEEEEDGKLYLITRLKKLFCS